MIAGCLDTDVLIRYVTGDDPVKEAAAARLLAEAEAGVIELDLSPVTIADAVYVLTSRRLYGLGRKDAAEALLRLIALRGIVMAEKDLVVAALGIFARHNVDFGDAYTAARSLKLDVPVVAFDRDFDRLPGVGRREP